MKLAVKISALISVVLVTTLFTGCGSGVGTAISAFTDVRQVVTTGESLSFNALTGGVNDLKLNPNTNLPGVAYYDKSAPISGTTAVGALKYAYMTADGGWVVEVVDANHGTGACGTLNSFCVGAPNSATGSVANILSLAFNSSGNPAIAYVFGASVGTVGFKQIRLAERLSADNWRVSVAYSKSTAAVPTNVAIATFDPMKSVTLNFDSADRPHITFAMYTQTVTNSSVEYSFRDTGGSWQQSTALTPIVTGAGTLTAMGQGANQAGAQMCGLNGMLIQTAFVVDGAAGAGDPILLRCTGLAANGACNAWSSVDMLTGCGGNCCFAATVTNASDAGSRMDLVIDPVTSQPVVGMYTAAIPANNIITAVLPNPCNVAQPAGAASWPAPVSAGGLSKGLNGFRLAASTTNYFLSFLTATTSVNLSVFAGANWFANGHAVETTTVGAEGVGLAYDATNDLLYTSYAALPGLGLGAFGNDIKVSVARPSDLSDGGADGQLQIDIIDTLVTAFPSTAVPMLTAATAPNGVVGYAYFYQDATVASSKLYYGVRSGPTTNPVFTQKVVANYVNGTTSPQFVGSYPSLAYDANSNPVIAFYNGVTGDQQLLVARSNNGGSSFSLSIVDDISTDVGQYASVAISGSTIGVAYYDVANTGLKFARYSPTTGWRRFSVDGIAGTGSCGNAIEDSGKYAVLQFATDGTPVIAYQSNGINLKIARAPEGLTSNIYTWNCGVADASAAQRGEGIDFQLDSSNHPHVVHFDATAGNIRYTTCEDDVSNCIVAGPFSYTSGIVGASGTSTAIVTKPSIRVTPTGTRYVTFYSASYQALALATLEAGGTVWASEFIDQAQSGTSFISAAGQYGVLLLNSSNYPMAFYRSNENWLKYFSREPN